MQIKINSRGPSVAMKKKQGTKYVRQLIRTQSPPLFLFLPTSFLLVLIYPPLIEKKNTVFSPHLTVVSLKDRHHLNNQVENEQDCLSITLYQGGQVKTSSVSLKLSLQQNYCLPFVSNLWQKILPHRSYFLIYHILIFCSCGSG